MLDELEMVSNKIEFSHNDSNDSTDTSSKI